MTPHSTLERLFNAITDRAINKTWIETLEPDGGAPWKELTEALEEAQTQLTALGIAADLERAADALPAPAVGVTQEAINRAVKKIQHVKTTMQNDDLSVEDAAVEIMQYATDGAMQLQREGYFSSSQDIGRETEALLASSREATVSARDAVIEECAKLADAYHPMLYAPEQDGRHPRDAAIKGTREEIAKAIRSLASGAKP